MALLAPANSSENAKCPHTQTTNFLGSVGGKSCVLVLSTLVDTGKCDIITVPSHGTCQGDVFGPKE